MIWEAGFRKVYSSYRSRAHRKGLDFTLSTADTYILLSSACWYCGTGPEREIDGFNCGTIDRIDSSKGYNYGNVRSACITCNRNKGAMDDAAFFDWIDRIIIHRRDRITQ